MRFNDTLRIVTRNLKRRKGRTILTAIGVTIGTAAIVAMMSLAIGLKEQAIKNINQFGNLTEIEVWPGYNQSNPSKPLLMNDETIADIKKLPGVEAVMPKLRFNGMAEVKFGRKIGNLEITGVDAQAAESFDYKMAEGKYLGGGRNEAVISYTVPDFLTEKKKRSRKNKDGQSQEMMPPPMPGSPASKAFRPNLVNKSATIVLSKMSEGGTSETREITVRVTGMLSESHKTWGNGVLYLPLETVKEMNKWIGSNQGAQNRREGEIG
nr:ABC transporter permease [Clostridia bacterium]